MLFALAGTVCVIVLTYYASKWYARRLGPIASGKHMKVVDRLVVSKTGSMLIVDIEGKQYLIGVSDQSVQVLQELEQPIPIPDYQERNGDGWKTLISRDKYQDLVGAIKKRRGVD